MLQKAPHHNLVNSDGSDLLVDDVLDIVLMKGDCNLSDARAFDLAVGVDCYHVLAITSSCRRASAIRTGITCSFH